MTDKLLKKLLFFIGLDIRKSSKFSAHGLNRDEWDFHKKGYYLRLFNLTIDSIDSPLITGYRNAKIIHLNGGGQFFYDKEDKLRLSIQGVNFFINFPDELLVIKEVFVSNAYNFRTTDEIVLIDIGLNIGATALFFAKQENVKKVYAYELFNPTYIAAQKNFSLNKSEKIISHNIGLGGEERQLTMPYSFSNKAVMGLRTSSAAEKFSDSIDVLVSFQDVVEEVLRIVQLEPGRKIVCKMDCEGSEFEILDKLYQKKALNLIDVYIIEWHNYDTHNVEVSFLNSGFDIIKSEISDSPMGLLYAFKRG